MIMKKLVSMTMAMAMMAALFVACGDDVRGIKPNV